MVVVVAEWEKVFEIVVVVMEVVGLDIEIKDTNDVEGNMNHPIGKDKTMEWEYTKVRC